MAEVNLGKDSTKGGQLGGREDWRMPGEEDWRRLTRGRTVLWEVN